MVLPTDVSGGEVTPIASVSALKALTCPKTETVASKTPTSAKPDKMTREVGRFMWRGFIPVPYAFGVQNSSTPLNAGQAPALE